jgi:hypothetical protein
MTHNYIDGVITLIREDGAILRFSHNPETLLPFESEDEALAYATNSTIPFSFPVDVKVELPKLSPVAFMLLFTAQERVAIKKSTDDIVMDFMSIVNDPRLTFVDLNLKSTQEAIAYLQSIDLLTAERAVQVAAGKFQ